jgi:transcriptional regulator with XRE-family HTH domain
MSAARMLREARLRAGLSQSSLARRADVSIRTVNRIELGEMIPRVNTLQRVLAACDGALTVTRRLGRDVDREPIRALLRLAPQRRLPPLLVRGLTILCARQVQFVLVGDGAARLHGAPVDAGALEIVLGDDRHNPARLRNALRHDWLRKIVRVTGGPYSELRKMAEEIPWVAAKARPRRVLNSWIGLPSGSIASLADMIRMASGERASLLWAVQEELDAHGTGYRIYRRAYE